MLNLRTLDALIRTCGIGADELTRFLLLVQGFYRAAQATERQAAFLDDLTIDAR